MARAHLAGGARRRRGRSSTMDARRPSAAKQLERWPPPIAAGGAGDEDDLALEGGRNPRRLGLGGGARARPSCWTWMGLRGDERRARRRAASAAARPRARRRRCRRANRLAVAPLAADLLGQAAHEAFERGLRRLRGGGPSSPRERGRARRRGRSDAGLPTTGWKKSLEARAAPSGEVDAGGVEHQRPRLRPRAAGSASNARAGGPQASPASSNGCFSMLPTRCGSAPAAASVLATSAVSAAARGRADDDGAVLQRAALSPGAAAPPASQRLRAAAAAGPASGSACAGPAGSWKSREEKSLMICSAS